MTVKRIMLAAMAATALGVVVGGVPANAQYGGRSYNNDEEEYRPRRYERRNDDDGYGYRPRSRAPYGNVCVTSRGNCPFETLPQYTPCKCDIPGFGPKRGAIGAF